MDLPEDQNSSQISPEEAMRQLIQLRMQLGETRFASMARQMGMPDELLTMVEQSVTEISPAAGGSRPSGLLDASGNPIGGGPSGLVDPSGRPLTGRPGFNGRAARDSAAPDDDEADDDLADEGVDEETSRQMFQELVGVRMIIGAENFGTLAQQMGMPSEASEMVEVAAGQVENEIATRYENQDEAMTVRLVNARMMMGQERFAELAGQVGMPSEVVDEVEDIAGQIETTGEGELPDDDTDDADEGPSLA